MWLDVRFQIYGTARQVDISTLDEQPGANLDIGRRQFVQVQRVRRLPHAGTLT